MSAFYNLIVDTTKKTKAEIIERTRHKNIENVKKAIFAEANKGSRHVLIEMGTDIYSFNDALADLMDHSEFEGFTFEKNLFLNIIRLKISW